MTRRWTVTVNGFGRTRVFTVEAPDEGAARREAMAECGITVAAARQVVAVDGHEVEVVRSKTGLPRAVCSCGWKGKFKTLNMGESFAHDEGLDHLSEVAS